MTLYEDFRNVIRQTLEGHQLTWTEIRTTAKLPQLFPNNQWVRRLEKDIGLERHKDAHGIIQWALRVNATAESTESSEQLSKASGRKQGRLE